MSISVKESILRRITMILNQSKKLLVALLLALIFANPIYAQAIKIANVNITEKSITIQGIDGYTNISFTIVGPDNFMVNNYLGDKKLLIVVDDFSSLKDGQYRYEITAATAQRKDDGKRIYNNGRANRKTIPFVPATQSGNFMIKGGHVITSDKRINNLRMMQEGADQDEK